VFSVIFWAAPSHESDEFRGVIVIVECAAKIQSFNEMQVFEQFTYGFIPLFEFFEGYETVGDDNKFRGFFARRFVEDLFDFFAENFIVQSWLKIGCGDSVVSPHFHDSLGGVVVGVLSRPFCVAPDDMRLLKISL